MNIDVDEETKLGLYEIEDLPARLIESRFYPFVYYEPTKDDASLLSRLIFISSLNSLIGVYWIRLRLFKVNFASLPYTL